MTKNGWGQLSVRQNLDVISILAASFNGTIILTHRYSRRRLEGFSRNPDIKFHTRKHIPNLPQHYFIWQLPLVVSSFNIKPSRTSKCNEQRVCYKWHVTARRGGEKLAVSYLIRRVKTWYSLQHRILDSLTWSPAQTNWTTARWCHVKVIDTYGTKINGFNTTDSRTQQTPIPSITPHILKKFNKTRNVRITLTMWRVSVKKQKVWHISVCGVCG